LEYIERVLAYHDANRGLALWYVAVNAAFSSIIALYIIGIWSFWRVPLLVAASVAFVALAVRSRHGAIPGSHLALTLVNFLITLALVL
jgi:hypothetical protein